MSRVREVMRDKRVAGALAALAILLVGYRMIPHRGSDVRVNPPAVEASTGDRDGMPAETPSPAPPRTTSEEQRSGSAVPGDRSPPGVAWSWQRNPFLPVGSATSTEMGPSRSTGSSGPGEDRGIPSDLRGTVLAGRAGMGGMAGIAIFGSRLVPVGGKIGDWTVERVEPYRVAVRKGHETRMVEMYKPAASGAEGKGGKP